MTSFGDEFLYTRGLADPARRQLRWSRSGTDPSSMPETPEFERRHRAHAQERTAVRRPAAVGLARAGGRGGGSTVATPRSPTPLRPSRCPTSEFPGRPGECRVVRHRWRARWRSWWS
ncbi:hypothetical protein HBB16_16455 [Pseudonocardia sp. MCCB 268]|nr:hypothetical protein [Pseudonocardia cytotoxica]